MLLVLFRTFFLREFSGGEQGSAGMLEVEFKVPRGCNLRDADGIVERVCSSLGLKVVLRGSLASYPGCKHWHFRKGRESGTLELTLDARAHRVWAKVQSGRRAAWIDSLLPQVQRQVESALAEV